MASLLRSLLCPRQLSPAFLCDRNPLCPSPLLSACCQPLPLPSSRERPRGHCCKRSPQPTPRQGAFGPPGPVRPATAASGRAPPPACRLRAQRNKRQDGRQRRQSRPHPAAGGQRLQELPRSQRDWTLQVRWVWCGGRWWELAGSRVRGWHPLRSSLHPRHGWQAATFPLLCISLLPACSLLLAAGLFHHCSQICPGRCVVLSSARRALPITSSFASKLQGVHDHHRPKRLRQVQRDGCHLLRAGRAHRAGEAWSVAAKGGTPQRRRRALGRPARGMPAAPGRTHPSFCNMHVHCRGQKKTLRPGFLPRSSAARSRSCSTPTQPGSRQRTGECCAAM